MEPEMEGIRKLRRFIQLRHVETLSSCANNTAINHDLHFPPASKMNTHALRSAPLTMLRACSSAAARTPRLCILDKWLHSRGLMTDPTGTNKDSPQAVPLRKHLKEEAKKKKALARASGGQTRGKKAIDPRLEEWELTVGIEIHAELNTAKKLFSSALADDGAVDLESAPNSRVAAFDAALPGAQPLFQAATLLPAVRGALVLGCEIQRVSGWDRKHYFHWDQPNGYQITQYYRPFAVNGSLTLTAADGVPEEDLTGGQELQIGIKQVQMEQDTAKTINVAGSRYQIDLNRAGLPLIEIITLPHIHSPQTAAAVVRKIQTLLRATDVCVRGMEHGGLRADVNVSVRRRGSTGPGAGYGGVQGLGQRTEIKNLSSFKAVEDAIIAERNRQINVLEAGGVVEGETRGWTLGASETTRLRGKEGEVDYRYMPDPDLGPLVIGHDLVEFLRSGMPELPDETVARVEREYGLSTKDAKTIVALDDGDRLEYMEEVVELLTERVSTFDKARAGKLAANWILHELGGLLTSQSDGIPSNWTDVNVNPAELADLLAALAHKEVTARAAKQLLGMLQDDDIRTTSETFSVEQLIDEHGLRLRPLTDKGYLELAQAIVEANPDMVAAVRDKGQKGKVMWFVGQMVRQGEEGTVEPEKARKVVEGLLLE
ncbi:Hypothetical protein R9X50_00720600 [Acrodontium crateriforme]|uniref:Glutamyl-tRNA(Gln) amidotransferase subunit B, mitochondrial n=1 Tax=Acrodontium crateriforme TaxID=150365 RepID=A0AAQ3M9C5_9PEZI|nr:Hypothetical protein R9X50_00720600 [Acrodontium crateriforme]